jgi:hypothetical protein
MGGQWRGDGKFPVQVIGANHLSLQTTYEIRGSVPCIRKPAKAMKEQLRAQAAVDLASDEVIEKVAERSRDWQRCAHSPI